MGTLCDEVVLDTTVLCTVFYVAAISLPGHGIWKLWTCEEFIEDVCEPLTRSQACQAPGLCDTQGLCWERWMTDRLCHSSQADWAAISIQQSWKSCGPNQLFKSPLKRAKHKNC